MALSINEISTGIFILLDDQIYTVIEVHHVKPGKGAAFVRVRLKNVKNDLVLERTFRSSDKIVDVFLEENRLQYQYRTGDSFHFMDQTSYEEKVLSKEIIGDSIQFLQDNIEVTALMHQHEIIKIYLPNFIVANIIEAEPGFKGDSSRAGTKPVKIDTGAMIQVPLFINKGDWVKVDTRSGSYVERVQK